MASQNKHKKVILIILIISVAVASAVGAFCIWWFLFRPKPQPSILLESNRTVIMPQGDESERAVQFSATYTNISNINDINTNITSPTVTWENYFYPLTGDNWSTTRTLQLKEDITTVDDFNVTVTIKYKNISSSKTIEVIDGSPLMGLFDTTTFNFGDYGAHDFPPGSGNILSYVFDDNNNPKLSEAGMTKNDLNLISQTESQNGWIFNCPNKVNDKVYYGTIDLTYDLSVKPTLNEVIPNEFLDLGQGSTPYHWSNPPTIDDIKWRFEHKYDAEDPTLWYNTYRLIFWNESDILDIQSRDATNHAVTVEVTSNGETYYNNTSTIVFTNIAWDN